MNKAKAKEHADNLYRKGVSAYAGKYTVAGAIGIPLKKLTDTALTKIMKEFYPLVTEGKKYEAIQKLYAEDKIKNT